MREAGAARILAGASLRGVCESVEQEILSLGGELAFPVQSSRNALAAHYCSSPEDQTEYAEGDLAKLDIGVHVDGWVVDTATTVNVGQRPENASLVEAARAALVAAIETAGPGVSVRMLSRVLEREIRGRGARPMRNLCGHGVGRYVVHGPPPIPNVVQSSDPEHPLAPGSVIAIEPFATDGSGDVVEVGPAEIFRVVNPSGLEQVDLGAAIRSALLGFHGLPFARRQLAGFDREEVERSLSRLLATGRLVGYPPLREAWGRPVAQAEHTLLILDTGVEVLTA